VSSFAARTRHAIRILRSRQWPWQASDGILNSIEPGDPLDQDLYDLEPEEAAKVDQVPGSLDEAISALEADHEFLMQGDVFTGDVLETWISDKRENEIDALRPRPHPYEFFLSDQISQSSGSGSSAACRAYAVSNNSMRPAIPRRSPAR